ncbi:fluoride efflux transporter CrcB [Brenneria goodwinii]|uniref:fluoride efflux transporter CrcB n=2 Tax=Brenneria goodwinii TaxID=1109412 RepID=UPI000EF1B3FD|nr:fluoride efflux transporter CrcB [Brenneria goodwinii]MCG8156938.1 fluoride efflux transporter CrcB [Brenneria goodwinii]MCG8161523.1 fluoride efflux transporter CrcB [Brenneria goodwinii]MCG8165588.1 fluoride efflux transporter CrcB [Brenneria goodwinii]MCG8170076.1 fluoride efflux transporter CrcB [Brenneria goodwinii]MCG8174286.1 fluoride efflux transporter CrcB [Brenneria goodwinii]
MYISMLLVVFVGGGLGSVARWMLSLKFNGNGYSLPVGTLLANLIGAFIIGAALAYFLRHPQLDQHWKILITTGLCGGLTTFSTFSMETVMFLQSGNLAAAGLHVLLNLAGSLLLTAVAFTLVTWLIAH